MNCNKYITVLNMGKHLYTTYYIIFLCLQGLKRIEGTCSNEGQTSCIKMDTDKIL